LTPFSLVVLEMTYRFIYGRKLFYGWRLVAALIIPVVTSLFAFTINQSPIFQYNAWLDTSNSVALLRVEHGPWMYVFMAYSYLLVGYSYYLLIRSMPQAAPWALRARWLFLIGRTIPLVLDGCFRLDCRFHLGLLPPIGMDYAPIGAGFTGILVALAVFGDRMGAMSHLARHVLVEKLNDLLIVIDTRQRVMDMNQAAATAFGVSLKDAHNLPAAQLLREFPEVVSYLQGPSSTMLEIGKNGQIYEVSVIPIETRTHNKPATFLHFHNITKRKTAERNHLLAKQAAEDANRAKSRYLAVMSHEIRGPLNSVLGFMNMLGQTPLNPEQREYIDNVLNSGDSLLMVVNEVLDYSKIEAGKIQLTEEPFDLAKEITAFCLTLEPEAEQKGLSLRTILDPALPTVVFGDKARLLQILRNLLSNAIKFTSRGGVRLEVVSLNQEKSRGGECLVSFSVTDTGIGLSPQEKARLFQPFSQATEYTQLQYGGTGLGLTISKSLSELMGGSLTVESTSGKGSTFTCQIKLRVETVEVLAKHEEQPVQVIAISSLKILVVDDQGLNRRLLQAMLSRTNHHVELAPDGKTCLALLDQTTFDVIIMDIEMLEMDGFETTRRVRAKEKARSETKPTFIIALTAHASSDVRDRCLAAGM
ncbi:MAG: ATP-binding protein, partial [Saprospiraceae bacterium]